MMPPMVLKEATMPRGWPDHSKEGRRRGKSILIGDTASCAKSGQKLPQGYYNVEVMLRNFSRKILKLIFAEPAWMQEALPKQN